MGGASAPLVLSSDWLTTGGRRTGESFTNGGRSGTSCLDNILWRVRGGRKEEGGRRREEGGGERKKERRESKEVWRRRTKVSNVRYTFLFEVLFEEAP